MRKVFTIKQIVFLCFYRIWNIIIKLINYIKNKVILFINTFLFYMVFTIIIVFLFHKILNYLNIVISEDRLYSLALTMSGIIGGAIAIVFSFSTFILQTSADLFSTQYLNKFINNIKEKIIYWILVFFVVLSFLTPILLKKFRLETLISILLLSFYLIFCLYNELRKNINPETTLQKIKNDAIKQLEKTNSKFKKYVNFHIKTFKSKNELQKILLDKLYKENPNSNKLVLENCKYLYEIGLRLLAKNEINSLNLVIQYIHDIYIKHLELRNGSFIRNPTSLYGTFKVYDEEFTDKIFQLWISIENIIIKEHRSVNINFLISIYLSILSKSFNIKFDDNLTENTENPIFGENLFYYIEFLEKILVTEEKEWIWESINSLSTISNYVFNETDDLIIIRQINIILMKEFNFCFKKEIMYFIPKILSIYLDCLIISWNKYEENNLFWQEIYKSIKSIFFTINDYYSNKLLVEEFFITHAIRQNNITNIIVARKKLIDATKMLLFIERWTKFLHQYSREKGLNNISLGLYVIKAIDNNLSIIYMIKNNFDIENIDKIYELQFFVLSYYFKKNDIKQIDSNLFNLEIVQELLLREIVNNFKNKVFDIQYHIELYTRLIDKHFKLIHFNNHYDHPRIVVKLIYLGLIINKYDKKNHEDILINLMIELNNNYLNNLKAKGLFEEYKDQLCYEIDELKDDIFSFCEGNSYGLLKILSEEIIEKEWIDFVNKIKFYKEYLEKQ